MKTVVLGDIHGRTIWKDIISKENPDRQHLGYSWAECSGYDAQVASKMNNEEFLSRFSGLTDWVYIDDELKTIFSHAGVSRIWLEEVLNESDIHNINNYGFTEDFGFTPNWYGDYNGDSTWIRPNSLIYCYVKDWNHVIGHTPVSNRIVDLGRAFSLPVHIWDCDALGINQYLVIDNGEFIPKSL